MLKLSFLGAAGEVTGSRHLLQTEKTSALLDCGMFQGHRHEAIEKNTDLRVDTAKLSTVLLSHAHIDHSGALPLLVRQGYAGKIHCADTTADLCAILLMDSAHLQEEDAKFFNRIHQSDGQHIDPLYSSADAEAAIGRLAPHPYREPFSAAPGLDVRFLNAGHVLGSAMVLCEVGAAAAKRRILFTGDLGRRDSILMSPPDDPGMVDYLIIESTYGGRSHERIEDAQKRLADVIARTVAEKGKLLIPSFALERTQELLFLIERLRRKKAIPAIPVYVDSPMAIAINDVFRKNMGSLSLQPELRQRAAGGDDLLGLESARSLRTPEESKSLNERPGPWIVIASSGMCEGGRILHHLRNNIEHDSTTVLLVGYQAEGTLGRRLQEGAKKVKIFGLPHEVGARVETIHSFSAHADTGDILWFIKRMHTRPRRIFLVHGEPQEREALAQRLKAEGIDRFERPNRGDSFDLD